MPHPDRSSAQARTGSDFLALREEAVTALVSLPDGLDAPTLASLLFGTSDGARWTALLATVLGTDPRFVQAGERWLVRAPGAQEARGRRTTTGRTAVSRVPAAPAPRPESIDARPPQARPSLTPGADDAALGLQLGSAMMAALDPGHPLRAAERPDRVAAIAIATTGADPERHRIARVAAVHLENGTIVARLDLVINTGQRLSRALREATRVSPEELDDAAGFAAAIEPLRDFIGERSTYAYGARRAQAFLAAELRRADLPPIELQFIEIDDLVRAVVPSLRKPGLHAAAAELGLQHVANASPLAQAELAARVVERLHARLASSPSRTLLDDAASGDRPASLPFTAAWLARVPELAGVYVVEDAAGRTLYVGKAVNLRRRLAAYADTQPSLHRGLEALAVRAARIATIVTDSDLEATLLEARLIRERAPEFNVARATRSPTTVIRAAPDARVPSVRLVDTVAADGARYLGPFESVSAARQALAVARAAYPAAFLRRRDDAAAQREAVLAVCGLLSGQKGPTLARLQEAMRAAAQAGDRAEVERLRTGLRDVQALALRPSDTIGRDPGWRLLVLESVVPGFGRLHLIEEDRLLASAFTDTSALPTDPRRIAQFVDEAFVSDEDDPYDDDVDSEVARPASWSPDDATILRRWLAQARQRLQVVRVPPLAESLD